MTGIETPSNSLVTITDLLPHGVSQLLVYLSRQARGGWPWNPENTLPVGRFPADEALRDIERRCRCTACRWRKADLKPDSISAWRRMSTPDSRRSKASATACLVLGATVRRQAN